MSWSRLVVVVLPVVLTACATIPLTPEQSAGLKAAQGFADEVTNAYRVRPVTLTVYEHPRDPFFHWRRTIGIGAVNLGHADVRRQLVVPLALATLDWSPSGAPTAGEYRREYLFDFTARAVEIYVRHLGVPPRQAIEWAGGIVGQLHHTQGILPHYFGDFHPCDLRRHLWSHLRMSEPMPGLGCVSTGSK